MIHLQTKSPSQAPTMTTIQKMIRGCDGAADDTFGSSLAVKGDWAAIGAYGESSSGAVYLYKHDGNHWVFMQSITASDGAEGDGFGSSVAMSETGHLVVGAPENDDMGDDSGAVYMYRLNSTSNTWGDEQKIVASDGATKDLFGSAVALSGTGHLVVGAPYDGDMGYRSGAVYAIGDGVSVSMFCCSCKIWMRFCYSIILTCLSIRWLLMLREETLLNLKLIALQQLLLLQL